MIYPGLPSNPLPGKDRMGHGRSYPAELWLMFDAKIGWIRPLAGVAFDHSERVGHSLARVGLLKEHYAWVNLKWDSRERSTFA